MLKRSASTEGFFLIRSHPETWLFCIKRKAGKLEPRWRGPFVIHGSGGEHGVSYQLRQLNERRIRGTIHGNHLKELVPQSGYLVDPTMGLFPMYQTLRKPKAKKGKTRN